MICSDVRACSSWSKPAQTRVEVLDRAKAFDPPGVRDSRRMASNCELLASDSLHFALPIAAATFRTRPF